MSLREAATQQFAQEQLFPFRGGFQRSARTSGGD